jgi:hypothetical protein
MRVLPSLKKLLAHNGGFVDRKLTWSSSFSVMSKLQGLRTKETDFAFWWEQIFFFSPKLLGQLWGPPSLLSHLYRAPFSKTNRLGLAIWPPTPKRRVVSVYYIHCCIFVACCLSKGTDFYYLFNINPTYIVTD